MALREDVKIAPTLHLATERNLAFRVERYELCRSVHSEANAIIAAPRTEMLGATLYMCCTMPLTGEIAPDTSNCMMCKRLIINAGIEWVVIRDTKESFRRIRVADWLENDDSLGTALGY